VSKLPDLEILLPDWIRSSARPSQFVIIVISVSLIVRNHSGL